MQKIIKEMLKMALERAKKANGWPDFELEKIEVEYPKNEGFGDYTTNLAMILAKKVGKNPMEIAENIRSQISNFNNVDLEKVEVVKPGYLNFYLNDSYFQKIIGRISVEQGYFGVSKKGQGIKINNEFISANPTGPLHLGNGRGGFYGDVLTKILRKNGFEVASEYYVNDAGEQVLKLGHSVLKDTEAVYGGEYIEELNAKLGKMTDVKEVGTLAAQEILEQIIQKTTNEKMQVIFDQWMSEKSLYDDGLVDQAVEMLRQKGLTFEEDGALWLRTTEFGDDKDRVLIKKNGQKTYFASDCGYLLSKKRRGFEKIIETWGADHHGYVARFAAAAQALGYPKEDIKFIIVQLVRLVKNGKEVRMSKRAGNVVYIDDLIEQLGHDVTRFFFLMYSPDSHMNFDMGLASERSQKNPVFYVQYAHARIISILEKAREAGIFNDQFSISKQDVGLLVHEKELSLIKELSKFPELVALVGETYEVHKLPHYAIKLADRLHSFYDACRVIDESNIELTKARLSLVNAARIVLAEALKIMGVSAPEKM